MSTVQFFNVSDLVDPATGNTYRDDNNAKEHSIPLNTLVEVLRYDMKSDEYVEDPLGLRLFVTKHGRDCDGTPLYYLSHMMSREYEEIMATLKGSSLQLRDTPYALRGDLFGPTLDGGYPVDNLKFLALVKEDAD